MTLDKKKIEEFNRASKLFHDTMNTKKVAKEKSQIKKIQEFINASQKRLPLNDVLKDYNDKDYKHFRKKNIKEKKQSAYKSHKKGGFFGKITLYVFCFFFLVGGLGVLLGEYTIWIYSLPFIGLIAGLVNDREGILALLSVGFFLAVFGALFGC